MCLQGMPCIVNLHGVSRAPPEPTGVAAGMTVAEVIVVSFSDNFAKALQSAACAEAVANNRQNKNTACNGRAEYLGRCRAECKSCEVWGGRRHVTRRELSGRGHQDRIVRHGWECLAMDQPGQRVTEQRSARRLVVPS